MRLKQLAAIMLTTAALAATTTVSAKAAETDEAAMLAQAEAADEAYARIAERTIELREREHTAPDAETPQHIVDEVLQSEYPRRVLRDSTVTYNGMVLGKHEITVCAFDPYDCKRGYSAFGDANRLSAEHFPGPSEDNQQDADRHCIWQALTTIRANVDFARKIGDAHEQDHPSTPEAEQMDRVNNETGREIGLRHEGDDAGAINECRERAANGQLVTLK